MVHEYTCPLSFSTQTLINAAILICESNVSASLVSHLWVWWVTLNLTSHLKYSQNSGSYTVGSGSQALKAFLSFLKGLMRFSWNQEYFQWAIQHCALKLPCSGLLNADLICLRDKTFCDTLLILLYAFVSTVHIESLQWLLQHGCDCTFVDQRFGLVCRIVPDRPKCRTAPQLDLNTSANRIHLYDRMPLSRFRIWSQIQYNSPVANFDYFTNNI